MIFARTMPHGSRLLERGDRYDQQALGFSDLTHKGLVGSRQVVPLSPETYAAAMAYRPDGAVGRGFTVEWLMEHGVLTAAQAEATAALPSDVLVYRGYRVVRWAKGIQRLWGVENAAGEPVRDQKFQSLERAQAFIDTLKGSDDRDLRPEPLSAA